MSKEQQIIDILKVNPFISQQELADQIGLSRPAIANYIGKLTKRGIIKGRAYILQEEFVICIGAANIDREAKTNNPVQLHASNPVEITETIGGVARNFASTLRKLDINTSLLTAIGDDAAGEALTQNAQSNQIDISQLWIFPDARTGTFTSLVNPDGKSIVSMADMNVYQQVSTHMIDQKWTHIQSARAVFLDTNFPREVIDHLLTRLHEHNIPTYVDAVSPIKVKKLPFNLTNIQLLTLTPKEVEAACGIEITEQNDFYQAAEELVKRGVKNIVIITDNDGIIYYSHITKGIVEYGEHITIHNDCKRNMISAMIMSGLMDGNNLTEAINGTINYLSKSI